MREGAKNVEAALALAQNDTMLFNTITEEWNASPTRQSMLGPNTVSYPVAIPKDMLVESLEQRDALLKSDNYSPKVWTGKIHQ